MLLEANGKMDTAFDELFHQEQDYPFAYFVVCIGFLMVLSIEHVVLSCVRNQPKVVVNEPNCRCETIIRSGLPGIIPTNKIFMLASGVTSIYLIIIVISPILLSLVPLS